MSCPQRRITLGFRAVPIVRPFRALRFGRDQLNHLDELISPAVRGEPENRKVVGDVHPFNIRRLVRGDEGPLAGPDEPAFTHAARLLQEWKEDGVMVRDARPGIYVYEQALGETIRRGIVCLIRLNDGKLMPHEVSRGGSTRTLSAQLAATRCQLSLVMAVVPDREGLLSSYLSSQPGQPWFQVVDGKGVRNRVWLDEDPAHHLRLAEGLRDEPAIIADGHHRVEAALDHQRQRAESAPSHREAPWDYVMTLVVPASDPGLTCRPSHRICETLGASGWDFLSRLGESFEITELETPDAAEGWLAQDGPPRFALVQRGAVKGLVLRGGVDAPDLSALPEMLRQVDAAVLGELVLDPLIAAQLGDAWSANGEDTGGAPSGSAFSHNKASAEEIAQRAFSGEIDVAFLLRPTPAGQVVAVAEAGGLMPPKSTNFQPKPIKGLLHNSLVSF